MSQPVIRLDNVTKTFRVGAFRQKKVEAVKGVSLEVYPGDIYGFLGPNGSGKTTTVRCILGLTLPSAGTITRFGDKRLLPVPFFSKTAYCPEESHFPGYLTGKELLTHWARMFNVADDMVVQKVGEALERVGITDASDRRIGTYSKGMKQRVGIAGCLLSDPEFVIMDEPSRGLDPLARHLIRNIISDLAAEGKTVFMNSHILSEAERVCNRIGIINQGKVVRQLSMSELTREVGIEVIYRSGPGGLPAPNGAIKTEDNLIKLTLPDTSALAEFTQTLVAEKGELISANKCKVELEQYFIKVVEEDTQ